MACVDESFNVAAPAAAIDRMHPGGFLSARNRPGLFYDPRRMEADT